MLMVLTTGAKAYQHVRDTVENHYSEDTCINYIAMKVRHYDDDTGSVELRNVGGVPTLYMSETIGGSEYYTAIYFYEGNVMEIYAEEDFEFAPGDGFNILEAQSLSFSAEGDLLRIGCVGTGGESAEVFLTLRTGRAVS
jgi:hypothetical protein